MAITQDNRYLQLSTPLAKNYLLIQRLRCSEALNQLFRIELELVHEENADSITPTTIDPKKVLGNPMIVSVHQAGSTERYFNGICVQFTQGSRTSYFSQYRAELVPKVWMLTQNSQSRIFQNKTVPQILEEVLKGYDFDNEIQGDFKPRNYCVQYRESDWDFVSRLMEEEGIYYYFEHTANNHRLIMGNVRESHRPCPSKPKVAYVLNRSELTDDWIPSIQTWRVDNKMRTGKTELRDFHFQLPLNDLLATQTSLFDVGGNKELEYYDWPGGYAKRFDGIDQGGGENPSALNDVFDDRERTVRIRQEEIDVAYKNIHASSDCCSLTAGYRFEFEHHPIKENNINHVVIDAQHEAVQNPAYISGEESLMPYLVNFTCMPHGGEHAPFRPLRITRKPIVHGSQTAKVVGNPGDEIFTDKYGRVKVHFHWDRSEYNDQQASAWIRVGTMFAGNKWGTMFIPRVGQEVIVDFLEGDPDQPIIVGSVYNAETMPHYELPKYKTLSYIKTHSTPKHQGYNELRFEDKAKKEQVFLYSQKRMDFRARGSHYETCGGNRQEVIGWNIKDGDDEDHGGNLAITVGGNYDLHVVGDQFIGIDKGLYETVKSDVGEEYKAKHCSKITGKRDLNAQTITLESLQGITLKVGASFIMVDLTGITIQGPIVKINSGGAAIGTTPFQMADPLDAEHADTGEPGYCDRPRRGGGGGRNRWRTVDGYHAPTVTRDDAGVYHLGNIAINQGARNPNFQRDVLNDLAIIGTTPTGAQTLSNIQNNPNGNTVTIVERNNPADPTNGGATGVNGANASNGTGTNTTIDYDPSVYPVSNATDSRSQHNSPSDALLHHELTHADHFTNGTRDGTPRTDCFTDNEEFNTIGNPGGPQPDNAYRRERGIEERTNHKDY